LVISTDKTEVGEKGSSLMDRDNGHARFLTPDNRRAIGKNLERSFPLDRTPIFQDVLKAIEAVERR
jgi:hypothetical protein